LTLKRRLPAVAATSSRSGLDVVDGGSRWASGEFAFQIRLDLDVSSGSHLFCFSTRE
jgi:hypothetical protein